MRFGAVRSSFGASTGRAAACGSSSGLRRAVVVGTGAASTAAWVSGFTFGAASSCVCVGPWTSGAAASAAWLSTGVFRAAVVCVSGAGAAPTGRASDGSSWPGAAVWVGSAVGRVAFGSGAMLWADHRLLPAISVSVRPWPFSPPLPSRIEVARLEPKPCTAPVPTFFQSQPSENRCRNDLLGSWSLPRRASPAVLITLPVTAFTPAVVTSFTSSPRWVSCFVTWPVAASVTPLPSTRVTPLLTSAPPASPATFDRKLVAATLPTSCRLLTVAPLLMVSAS